MQKLTFNVPKETSVPLGAVVSLSGAGTVPIFYTYQTSMVSSAVKTVECYDCGMFTDADMPEITVDSNGCASFSDIVNAIRTASGLALAYEGAMSTIASLPIPQELFKNRTIREALSALGEAAGGCWIANTYTVKRLRFKPYLYSYRSTATLTKYSTPAISDDTVSCQRVLLTNGSKVWSTGTGIGNSILSVDTILGCDELNRALVANYYTTVQSYKGWSCQAKVDGYIFPWSDVAFGDDGGHYHTADCIFNITRNGIFAQLAAPEMPSNYYTSKISRELAERLKLGETNGNTKINRDGLKFINSNSGTEYGFTVTEQGLTSFDGAIMDKTLPTKVEKETDTSKIIYYGNKKYRLSWTVDASGNKTNFVQEEITEQSSAST